MPPTALPLPLYPQEDAERVLELARELGSALGPLDEDVVRAFASVSAGELCPVASFIGALAAQEAMKVSSHAVSSAVPGLLSPSARWPREGTCCLPGDTGCSEQGPGWGDVVPMLGTGTSLAPGHHGEVPAPGSVVLL